MTPKLLATFLFFVLIQSLQAQEKFEFNQPLDNRKTGIYKNYEEFIKNQPSILKPFKLTSKISIEPETKDTTNKGLTYEFLDSSKKIKNVWGLFDGKKVYFNINKDVFISVNYIGRYTFFVFDEKNRLELGGFLFMAVSAVDVIASPSRKTLYYYNEKGKLIEGTSQAIGWLIRKEKDLAEEIRHEKYFNIDTYVKYLVKMNERYPL